MKGIYIHIPFCVKKCNYCDFLSFPAEEEVRKAYVNELIEEIKHKAFVFEDYSEDSEKKVETIFIGGGTPSILDGSDIEKLVKTVKREFDVAENAEITMESNPGTALFGDKLCNNMKSTIINTERIDTKIGQEDQHEKLARNLAKIKECGVNRVSIGLQSTNNKELELLGRIHSVEDFEIYYEQLRRAGFNNLNIDLISGLPNQTVSDWNRTLERVCQYKPEHISAYSLIIEEGTPFFKIYGEDWKNREAGKKPAMLPSEEIDREIYLNTKNILIEEGYNRYEISNYAKAGFECRHNSDCWRREDYLGIGLGASSLINNKRYKNLSNIDDYIGLFTNEEYYYYKSMYDEVIEVDLQGQMEEFMFLGLRMMEGISIDRFNETFAERTGVSDPFGRYYGEICKVLVKDGLLEEINCQRNLEDGLLEETNGQKNLEDTEIKGKVKYSNGYRLTEAGIDVSNYVFSKMLLE